MTCRGGAVLVALVVGIGACRDAPPVADAPPVPVPQAGVDVEAVTLWLDLDVEALRLGARATLTVAHPDTLTVLTLGLDGVMDVRAVRVDGRPVVFRHDGDALRVPIPGAAVRSAVEVVYSGTPSAGLYAGTWNGRRVAYTDAWPTRAAGWLPTVHHPSDPLRLDLTLVVPESLVVVGSGTVVSDSLGGGRRHTRFRLGGTSSGGTDGTPPYTAAFAVGSFTVVDGGTSAGGVAVRHALLDAALAPRLARTAAMLDTLAALFGPYPYATYTTVQVPMTYAGMENAATPFLRAELYAANVDGRNPVEEVNAHELVHQWWGNAVATADWRDLWLAEGPATYLTADLYARLDGPDAGRRHLVRLVREIEPADADRRLVPTALERSADALSPTVYHKGASVLHLLRLTVGEAAFWRAMRQIQTDFATRPLSTAQFQATFERASGRSLEALFQRWVYGEGRPRLVTRWDRASRTLAWEAEDDGGTLSGVPFDLYVRQRGQAPRWLPATDGVATLAGTAPPTVEPVGLLLDVR